MNLKAPSNFAARDIATVIHPYTNLDAHKEVGPHVMERGEGIYMYDDQGRRLIEGMSGLWCAGLGFSNQELIDAATEQLHRLPYAHIFAGRSYEPAIELAEKLKEICQRSRPASAASRVFFASSGSEANDTQVKLAWYLSNEQGRPEKKKIISRVKGYHGVTIVSASLTGLPNNHREFDLPVDRIVHTSSPHHWREAEPGESEESFVGRLVADLEALIEREGPETIAAMIAEPVMGAGGVIVPPKGYYEAIGEVLARNDIRLIADEVITGFGRLGTWTGSERMGLSPNSFSFAKQLTAAYMPLSAVVVDDVMAEALEAQSRKIGVFGHGFTYGGHPVACAVGVKTLEIYERENIPARVSELEPRFLGHLNRLAEHPLVGEGRGVGLVGALELAPDKSGKTMFSSPGKVGARASQELVERGVILRAIGDTLAVCPPMIITADEIDEMFEPVEAALDAAAAWAKKEGLL